MDHNKQWNILQEMGLPDELTCLLRNLYSGQEAIVRTGHGTTDWERVLSKVLYIVILLIAGTKLESRLPQERSITSDM